MKAWLVEYYGRWLGGRAVVIAESEEEALKLVKEHPMTLDWESPKFKPKATELQVSGHTVLYNDNGDY